jgi:phosphoglycolate phosphatase
LAYRLIIFDFDGTLADSLPWFESVLNSVAAHYGFRRIDPSERDFLRRLDGHAFLDHLGVPKWKVPLIARYMRALKAESLGEISLFSGVEDLLRDLRDQGVKLAMVSSDTEENVRTVLGPLNAELFSDFACSASFLGKKTKFRRVLRRAGVRPDEALAIGDEIRDALAAHATGIRFAAVGWGYADPEVLAGHAERVFSDIGEIAEFCCGYRRPPGPELALGMTA